MKVVGIIPTHNHAAWVMDAVRSMADQCHKPRAIALVDDGSDDNTREIVAWSLEDCQELPGRDMVGRVSGVLVHYISRGRLGGPSQARNLGIKTYWEHADVFALLDSDDLYMPGKIRKSLACFKKHPNTGVVYSDYTNFRADGSRIRQWKEPFSYSRLRDTCIVNCDSLVSRRAFELCGLFAEDLRVCEDYDRWLSFALRFNIVHIPESLVDVRVGPHSSTDTVPSDQLQYCFEEVMRRAEAREK